MTIAGYGVHISQLTDEDVRIHKVDLDGLPVTECIAVEGEDLGRCLAAVVHYPTGKLLWSDASGEGDPITLPDFGPAVITLVHGVLSAAL